MTRDSNESSCERLQAAIAHAWQRLQLRGEATLPFFSRLFAHIRSLRQELPEVLSQPIAVWPLRCFKCLLPSVIHILLDAMQATASGYPTPEVQSTCCEGRVTDTSQGNLWVSLQKRVAGWLGRMIFSLLIWNPFIV